MKIGRRAAIAFSGMTWMVGGLILLWKGFGLLLDPTSREWGLWLSAPGGVPALILVSVGLLLGFCKGRWVLFRSAKRVMSRLAGLPDPCSVFALYSLAYLCLIVSMIAVGVGMRYLPYDLRALVDVTIGSALVNSSAYYFRALLEKGKKLS